jgi:hypothetical protein
LKNGGNTIIFAAAEISIKSVIVNVMDVKDNYMVSPEIVGSQHFVFNTVASPGLSLHMGVQLPFDPFPLFLFSSYFPVFYLPPFSSP